jgi:hypothetical protein
VCPKIVDYTSQCPKGHKLVTFSDRSGIASARRLMCRMCHAFAECVHACQWLVCSVTGCCGEYSVCDTCVGVLNQVPVDKAADNRSHPSPPLVCSINKCLALILLAFTRVLQGISVMYLRWLKETLGPLVGRLTVEQVCQTFIKPRTSRSHGSLMHELMLHAGTGHYVGEATWFISHTWGNAFMDTLNSILLFFEGREDASTAKVWIDVLVDAQHAIAGPSKPSSWYMTTFRDMIASIGRLLLVADKWNHPTALTRAW